MKTTIIIATALFLMSSCAKDWECCVETTVTGHQGNLSQANGTTTYCYDFKGDFIDKAKEQDSIVVTDIVSANESGLDSSYTWTQTKVTDCVPD